MKKKELIIHVGTHKTGTSSIQSSLYACRNKMLSHYFDFGEPNHSHVMASIFLDDPYSYHFHRKLDRSKFFVDDYIASWKSELSLQIKNSEKEKFIISAEDLCVLKKEELSRMKVFLEKFFLSVNVICYLRPPVSYMQSYFQQRLKGGVIDLEPEKLYPNYRRIVDKFFGVFGEKKCEFIKFSPECLVGGDVVVDFMHRIGDKGDVKSLKVNESMSAEATALLFIYRNFNDSQGVGVSAAENNRRVISLLETFGKKKFLFGKKYYNFVSENKSHDIAWLNKKTGVLMEEDFKEFGDEAVYFVDPQDFVGYGKAVYMEFIKKMLISHEYKDVRVKNVIKAIDFFTVR